MLYNHFSDNLVTNYGIESKTLAKTAFEKEINIKIQSVGLFVNRTRNFLAASPDGLIECDGIIN